MTAWTLVTPAETSPIDWPAVFDQTGSLVQDGAAALASAPAAWVGAVVLFLVIVWLITQ